MLQRDADAIINGRGTNPVGRMSAVGLRNRQSIRLGLPLSRNVQGATNAKSGDPSRVELRHFANLDEYQGLLSGFRSFVQPSG